LGLPLLGNLKLGAPADIIAVKGDPALNIKNLEYPERVFSVGSRENRGKGLKLIVSLTLTIR
jgi:imidazolonepropionase-like amidohydrolase